jgi:hypothetical protein
MLAHCVNEGCNRPLHSFSEGRLFQFEVVSISVAASDENCAPFDERPQRQTLNLWLCGRCAATMMVVLEPTRGVQIVALDHRSPENRDVGSVNAGITPGKEC